MSERYQQTSVKLPEVSQHFEFSETVVEGTKDVHVCYLNTTKPKYFQE